MVLIGRPILPTADARALLAGTRDSDDQLLHAAVSLLLLAGLRPGEAEELRVRDYTPGVAPQLRVGGAARHRQIRLAPSAAGALDLYLAGQDAEPEEFLLAGLQRVLLVQLVRRAAKHIDVEAGVADLRQTAIAAALEDGAPVHHVRTYFGVPKAPGRKDLLVVPGGYDAGIAAALEAAFVG